MNRPLTPEEQAALDIKERLGLPALREDAWKYAAAERDNPNKNVDTRRRFQTAIVSLIP